jgi:hypothetical protein
MAPDSGATENLRDAHRGGSNIFSDGRLPDMRATFARRQRQTMARATCS